MTMHTTTAPRRAKRRAPHLARAASALRGSLAVLAAAAFAPAFAQALSLDASAGIATSYLFRGADLSDGEPAFFGDAFVNVGAAAEDGVGAYAGVWLSSGDTAAGAEYDVLAGVRWQRGWLGLDFGAVSYVYPDRIAGDPMLNVTTRTVTLTGGTTMTTVITSVALVAGPAGKDTDFGEFSEAYLGLSAGPVSLYYYDNVAGNTGYSYVSLGWDIGDFSLLVAEHGSDAEAGDYRHADLTWNYNDYLSLTVSARFSEGADAEAGHNDTVAAISLSLPINLDPLQ